MSFEIIHFRKAQQILKKKKMMSNLTQTLEYLDNVLSGTQYRSELFREALSEMGWRNEKESLAIFENRRYQYKGVLNRIAMEGSFASYEYILEGLMKLQLGFTQGKIDSGILLLTGVRSEKSPYGTSADIAKKEVEELLYPTISLPVTLVLFNLGRPFLEQTGVPEREDELAMVGAGGKEA